MTEERFSNIGIYNSAFIKMEVHCTEELNDLTKVGIHTEATYFHEYIHFLQDISTTYGLINISTIVDYMKYVTFEARNDKKVDFSVPMPPQFSSIDDVKANWELKKIYLGDKGHPDYANTNKVGKFIQPVNTKSKQIFPESLFLDFNDSKGTRHQLTIGAHCITECMAYLMEQELYPGVLPGANKLPYQSVKILCDHLLPGFSLNSLNVIALCDACLMLFHPGQFLYDILLEMARKKYNPTSPEDVYNYVYSKLEFNYNGASSTDQLLQMHSNLAKKQFGDYFTTPEFKDNKSWVNSVLDKAAFRRINDPYFMLRLVQDGRLVAGTTLSNNTYTDLLRDLGTPIIVNDDKKIFFIPPQGSAYDLKLQYLWVINQVYKIFRDGLLMGAYKCEMIDWCDHRAARKGIPEYTNYDCRNSPWLRSEEIPLSECPFGRLWYTWSMKDEHPV